jgi:hypothetical protein
MKSALVHESWDGAESMTHIPLRVPIAYVTDALAAVCLTLGTAPTTQKSGLVR